MLLQNLLLLADLILLALVLSFTLESTQEQEPRAAKVGKAGVCLALLLAGLILLAPSLHLAIALLFLLILGFIGFCLLPGKPNAAALAGAQGHVVGEGERFDERDIVFARQRMQADGSPQQAAVYRRYYDTHPDREAPDAQRRSKGLLGTVASIDQGWPPNVAMLHAGFDMPDILGPHGVGEPDSHAQAGRETVNTDPAQATERVKNLARHIGADMVGVCKVNPLWVYSHRGEIHYNNFEEWGRELTDYPPYAVVFLTEMNWEHVSAAPHSPSVVESANDYAKGSYLSTYLARWFAHMGYRGVAQNTRRYDTLLCPLAVDAGLGEVGRHGYLIAPKYGARVRIFATLTDMPLVPDTPISIGVDEFCRRCKKCAEACPSRSIPHGGKVTFNGVSKWKLDEDSCFDFWSKVGTDCSICMAICPFSRPDTFSHGLVRWLVARSAVAKALFPTLDNLIYGTKWKSRQVAPWLDYPKGQSTLPVSE